MRNVLMRHSGQRTMNDTGWNLNTMIELKTIEFLFSLLLSQAKPNQTK